MIKTLNREEFEAAYVQYMDSNSYQYEDFDIRFEWDRYTRGRSWFIYQLHGADASAVVNQLQNRV